jgi:hypothetical protein
MNIYPVLKKKKLIYTLSLNLKIYQLFLSQPINVKCITNRIPTRQPGMVGHTDSPKTQKWGRRIIWVQEFRTRLA